MIITAPAVVQKSSKLLKDQSFAAEVKQLSIRLSPWLDDEFGPAVVEMLSTHGNQPADDFAQINHKSRHEWNLFRWLDWHLQSCVS